MDDKVKILHDDNIEPIRRRASMPMSRFLRNDMTNILQE